MATTRDQLISEWRHALAAAEESVIGSPRLAWLARTKVRLYRFLLACYGSDQWQPPPQGERAPLVFDLPESESQGGKPARSVTEIRSVLSAVARAQGDERAPGPLAGGLDHDSWVVVAAASSKLKLGQCQRLLTAAGLHPRACYRGDDQMLEVPACERHEAFEIIERNRDRIQQPPRTPRTQRIPLWCRVAAGAIVALWLSALLSWMLNAFIWTAAGPQISHRPPTDYLNLPGFVSIWCSLFLAMLLVIGLRFLRTNRPVRARERGASR